MAYVGNWPTTIGFRTMNFKAVSDTKVTTSQSGRSVRVSTAGTRFAGTIQYPPMVVGNFKPIQIESAYKVVNVIEGKVPKDIRGTFLKNGAN